MSLVDVLKSVGELANAINKKTRELDELKHLYDSKLRDLNTYIESLHISNTHISPEVLQRQLDSQIHCPKCDECIWENGKQEFVLIPKQLIELESIPATQNDKFIPNLRGHSLNDQAKGIQEIQDKLQQHNFHRPTSDKPDQKPQHNKSKRICSYCKKTGHSRARCYKRLNGEKPSD